MENAKLTDFENKLNELLGREMHFQNKLLNDLSVDKIILLAEELSLEWQQIIRHEHLDQTKKEIQNITSFFLQAFHLRNLFLEAQSFFLNITIQHIHDKEEALGFKLITDQELAEITAELTNPKQNILEAINLLSNENVADRLCFNYNEMNLYEKLEALKG